jgi:hypothetical protein
MLDKVSNLKYKNWLQIEKKLNHEVDSTKYVGIKQRLLVMLKC